MSKVYNTPGVSRQFVSEATTLRVLESNQIHPVVPILPLPSLKSTRLNLKRDGLKQITARYTSKRVEVQRKAE